MDVVALILACIATLVFLFSGDMRIGTWRFGNLALGLALLTVALIFQFIHLTSTVVTAH